MKVDRIDASDIRLLSVVFLICLLLLAPVLYFVLGCGEDWLVITGLFIDAVGAVLLAAPDLGFLRRYTYSGSIKEILDELEGTGNTWVREEADWYDVFLNEMKEVLGTEKIPDRAEFRIERSRNSNLLLYMPDPGNNDEKAINLFNVFTPFRDTIEEEETRIRRYGAGVFVAGILFQIVGILYDTILFRSILC